MSEPYLILHKVRGEPAFDIAIKILDECHEDGHNYEDVWIIPTSGHRAYPYWFHKLEWLGEVITYEDGGYSKIQHCVPEMPKDWPDHYSCNDRPIKEDVYVVKQRAKGLLETLNLVKKVNVERRF